MPLLSLTHPHDCSQQPQLTNIGSCLYMVVLDFKEFLQPVQNPAQLILGEFLAVLTP
jgi:hypothetical protein